MDKREPISTARLREIEIKSPKGSDAHLLVQEVYRLQGVVRIIHKFWTRSSDQMSSNGMKLLKSLIAHATTPLEPTKKNKEP